MREMACGLVDSGQPFLWVVRRDAREKLAKGFAEAVGERGLVVVLSEAEMREMACGLVDSGWSFLWVVRSDAWEKLPEGFAEVAGERGLVVEWSPQDRVLAHPAVGCFMTHCGWNSTLEALAVGVPVVAYPQWGDQVPDAKMLVEEWRVGVWLRASATKDEVRRCVEAVTVGKGAEVIRAKAAEWSETAKKAMSEGGTSDRHIEAFVEVIRGGGGDGHGNASGGARELSDRRWKISTV